MTKLYKVNITIFNDLGELVDTQLTFTSLDEMSLALTNSDTMYKLVEQARDFATQENMLLEELYDSKEEAEFDKEDKYEPEDILKAHNEFVENLTSTSPLNNPANFAN